MAAVTGVMGQMAATGTDTVTVPQGDTIIIIATNAGGGASWMNVNPPMSSSGMTPQTHQVMVGGTAGLVYTPNTINAAIGDYVQFNFMSQNHTVTQSSFQTPCVNAKLLDTGFTMANPNNTINPPPAMKLQVNTTDPQWFYCKQKTPESSHCGMGMTFSINPTAAKSQAMFMAMAMQQNGTAAGAAPPASSAAAAAPPAATSVAAAPPAATSMASGTGTTDGSGNCQCSCLCGVAQFPMAAQQGIGNFGGMSGALPAGNMQGGS
ncbi:MAG: hypothetical protein LQ340_002883 [Diploschistes diacapsis]|nr:MAG: hypothetical protein LQ340_002883 [Diploschistes diacapsis]